MFKHKHQPLCKGSVLTCMRSSLSILDGYRFDDMIQRKRRLHRQYYLCLYLSIYLSICLSIYLSIYLSICIYEYKYSCKYVCVYIYINPPRPQACWGITRYPLPNPQPLHPQSLVLLSGKPKRAALRQNYIYIYIYIYICQCVCVCLFIFILKLTFSMNTYICMVPL